mmetsp:Transcript_30027/g.84322  ORF Transcript_30027/g.84322 Transcript_30027/m.84322 type:complete len:386 (-) Transcript_30027:70-1227(-)
MAAVTAPFPLRVLALLQRRRPVPPTRSAGSSQQPLGSPQLSISPLEIARMPKLEFQGRVLVINTLEDEQRVELLFSGEALLGFDSESRPSSALSPRNKTALVQLSSEHAACLWRIGELKQITPLLRRLLEDPAVHKVAQGASQELTTLREEYGLNGQSFIDLHHMALNMRTTPRSLQGLVALFMKRRLMKDQRLTDWEQKPLTQAQIEYAALDAYASRQVLLAMRRAYGTDRLECERLLSGAVSPALSPGFAFPASSTLPAATAGAAALGAWAASSGKASASHSPAWPPKVPAPAPRDEAHQKLVAVCVSQGFVLRFDGFESAPNGFRCVFSIEIRRQGRLIVEAFRSKRVHSTIRAAQNDAATEALVRLTDGSFGQAPIAAAAA